jgi:osomolarity two-component system sensor histidine kinase SLN1
MDAGRFESVSKPYAFHKVIRSLMVGLQLAAEAKGLEVIADFDPNIDLVARTMMYREQGKSEEWINWQLAYNPHEDAELMGDEMRLVQVVTNLTSNACKVSVVVWPRVGTRFTLLIAVRSSPRPVLMGA